MASSMRAVVQYALEKGAVEIRDVPVPEIGAKDVLLKVEAVGVCGSDVHQYHNRHSWPVNIPVILGHEFCGRIETLGSDVKGFSEGERVVSETAAEVDENAPLVKQGLYNLDPSRKGFGYDVNGAMTQFVKVPARCLHRVPESVPSEHAALTEPCCVGYQATVVHSPVKEGSFVVVIGPGPIGLLCAKMASIHGAKAVLLVGVTSDRGRMDVGLKAGATHAADVLKEDVGKIIADLSGGLGADIIIDSAGISSTLKQALQWVRPAGHITKVGWGAQPMDFSLDPLVRKAVTLQGSFSHNYPVWEKVLGLMGEKKLDIMPFVSRVSPLADWKACFDGMTSGELIKAVLKPS
jgi:alcohol dehydrogenase/L-iditol 2-dehydrogenase